ncbi:unnamed protein product [Rhodiola kirilowii]
MSILCWNCRGLGKPSAVRELKNVIMSHSSQIVGLIETKRKVRCWESLRCRLGFLNCFAIDRVGLSGGLAVLWREGVDVQINSYSRFHIDMDVEMEGRFRFTLFYGNPNNNLRNDSWRLLECLYGGDTRPWMVAGDFNEIFFSWEAQGKTLRDRQRMRQFRECTNSCGLMDLGFKGNRYTYSNKRLFPNEARARLDRVFGNNELRRMFPNLIVKHGVAITSDHCPIIIENRKLRVDREDNKFTYEAMWHKHKNFPEVVRDSWSKAVENSNSIVDALEACAQDLNSWNTKVFGNVMMRIRKIEKKLKNIKELPRTTETVEQEKLLESTLDEWLAREEYLWRQRSRIQWLKKGDRNTAFFHAKASQRRVTNTIDMLLWEGTEITELPEILKVTGEYFDKIFASSREGTSQNWLSSLGIIPCLLSEDMKEALLRPYTREEVKKALF